MFAARGHFGRFMSSLYLALGGFNFVCYQEHSRRSMTVYILHMVDFTMFAAKKILDVL